MGQFIPHVTEPDPSLGAPASRRWISPALALQMLSMLAIHEGVCTISVRHPRSRGPGQESEEERSHWPGESRTPPIRASGALPNGGRHEPRGHKVSPPPPPPTSMTGYPRSAPAPSSRRREHLGQAYSVSACAADRRRLEGVARGQQHPRHPPPPTTPHPAADSIRDIAFAGQIR